MLECYVDEKIFNSDKTIKDILIELELDYGINSFIYNVKKSSNIFNYKDVYYDKMVEIVKKSDNSKLKSIVRNYILEQINKI